jgi:hypothetical protein
MIDPAGKAMTATDPAEKAMTATDPAGKTQSSQRDDRSSREGRSNGDPVGKAATLMDPTKVMKGGGGGVGPAGQGLCRSW